MGPLDAFGAFQAALGAEANAARVQAARREFEKRAGAFGPEDAWFEARSRAFWDDAVTDAGLLRGIESQVASEARVWMRPLVRAHRGLFVVEDRADEVVLRDLLTGIRLFVDDADPGTRDALEAANAPFDGRVVAGGSPPRTALLPGAVFHPEDAATPIAKLLDTARQRGIPPRDVLDAMLRMELRLRSLSRVKASYAYRTEALPQVDPKPG